MPSASRIAWPFGGGAQWYISQGYNGSSHYNANSTYQYHYSFDLARVDGNTAGEPVYSPVTGTIRWIDPSTGGMSINLGDGYAVAFFHVTLAPGLADGQESRRATTSATSPGRAARVSGSSPTST